MSQTKNRREKILISGYEIAEKGLKLRLQATWTVAKESFELDRQFSAALHFHDSDLNQCASIGYQFIDLQPESAPLMVHFIPVYHKTRQNQPKKIKLTMKKL